MYVTYFKTNVCLLIKYLWTNIETASLLAQKTLYIPPPPLKYPGKKTLYSSSNEFGSAMTINCVAPSEAKVSNMVE